MVGSMSQLPKHNPSHPSVTYVQVIEVDGNSVTGTPVPDGTDVRVLVTGASWALTDTTIRHVAYLTRTASSVVVEGTDGAERISLRLPYDWDTLDKTDVDCRDRLPTGGR